MADSEQALEVPEELTVGIALTTDPSTTRELLEQFCYALADATGIKVVPRGVWHYHHLLQELEDGTVDVVWLPPILALRATANGAVTPIAMPVRNGVSDYRAALFAKTDSPIRTVEDLKGVHAAWVDRQSAAGYLIIRAHLEKIGVKLDDAFASDMFVGTHDGVAGAVQDGEADVGATYVYLEGEGPAAIPRRAGWGDHAMHIITYTRPIPSDVIATRKGVPELVRRIVQSALVEVQNAELQQAARALLGAEGFIAPTAEHLSPLIELLSGLKGASATPHSFFPPPPPPRDED